MHTPEGSDGPIRRWLDTKAGKITSLWTKQPAGGTPSKDAAPVEDPSARATRLLQEHLKLKEIEAAIGVYLKARRTVAGWQPSEREYLELVQGIVNLANWDAAVAMLQDYLENSAKADVRIRLKLAQILIRHRSRPAKALDVLAAIPPHSLPESLEATRAEMVRRAEAMIADGVLEIDEDPR